MNFQRPETLKIGCSYWLFFVTDDQGLPIFTEVTFVDYTSCPAIVVVRDNENFRMRVNRKDLYKIVESIPTTPHQVHVNIPHKSPASC